MCAFSTQRGVGLGFGGSRAPRGNSHAPLAGAYALLPICIWLIGILSPDLARLARGAWDEHTGRRAVLASAAQHRTGRAPRRSLSRSTHLPLGLIDLKSSNHPKILPGNSLFPPSLPRASKQQCSRKETRQWRGERLSVLVKTALISLSSARAQLRHFLTPNRRFSAPRDRSSILNFAEGLEDFPIIFLIC